MHTGATVPLEELTKGFVKLLGGRELRTKTWQRRDPNKAWRNFAKLGEGKLFQVWGAV